MEGTLDEESTPLSGRDVVATIWAALAIGLLGCIGLARIGHVHWIFDLFAHFQVQYALLGAVGALLGFALKARLAAILFVIAAGFASSQLFPLFKGPTQETRTGMGDLRVLMLNVLTANTSPDKAVDWILSENADVLVLQETSQSWIDRLDLPLQNYERLATKTVRNDNFGMSVYVQRLSLIHI